MGQTAALNLWYFDTRPKSQKRFRAFEGPSYLAYKIKKTNYVLLYFLFTKFKSPFSVLNIHLLTAIGKYSLLKRDN